MDSHFYEISTLQIFRESNLKWKLHRNDYAPTEWERKCLYEIWQFNFYKKQLTFLSEARKICGYKEDAYSESAWENEKKDLLMKGFDFTVGTSYEINPNTKINEPVGIAIREDLFPNYLDPDERDYYHYLFHFRFMTLAKEYPGYWTDFLFYHFTTYFNGDKVAFKAFLLTTATTKSNFLKDYKQLLLNYVEAELPLLASGAKLNEPGFEVYLNEGYRDKIGILVKEFKGSKPGEFAKMLMALIELKIINEHELTSNKSSLHKALRKTFGKVGVINALGYHLNKGHKEDPRVKDLAATLKLLLVKEKIV